MLLLSRTVESATRSKPVDTAVSYTHLDVYKRQVGYSWIDTLKEITTAAVSDEQMAHAAERFPINTPQNKEEYYYRSIFEEH